jgi:hypothetical protein
MTCSVIAIVGSRGYRDKKQARSWLYALMGSGLHDSYITGDAPGPDTWAAEVAAETGTSITVYPANWKGHGKAAGAIRNSKLVTDCHEVIALWDGKSKGTLDTIRKAVRAGRQVRILPPIG